jgi:hypothetical protein
MMMVATQTSDDPVGVFGGTPGSVATASSSLSSPATDAEAEDVALVAQRRGWTVEDVRRRMAVADALGRVAVAVAEEQPETFVGSALSDQPAGALSLYVKGTADARTRALVAEAGIEIDIVDGQTYSLGELEAARRTCMTAC